MKFRSHIRNMVDKDAHVIFGSAFNPDLDGVLRVSVVATGIDAVVRPSVPAPAPSRREPQVFAPPAGIFGGPAPIRTPGAAVAVAEPVITAALDDDMVPEPEAAISTAAEPEELDLAAFERVDEEEDISPAAMMRFTPAAPVVPIPTRAMEAAQPEPEERPLTLFEKMMNLSRGPKAKALPPATLAPDPEPGMAEVEIPPFFKRQVNS